MAAEVREFTVTVPAGHTPANPVVTDVSFPSRVVRQIDWKVPPGPMGQMGWRLTMNGNAVLPTSSAVWIITDGKDGTWRPENYPDSGAWQVTAYNTGAFPHNVYLTFHLDLPAEPAKLATSIPAYELYPGPPLDKAGPPVRPR